MNQNISRSYFDIRKSSTKDSETFDEKISKSYSDLRKNNLSGEKAFELEDLEENAAEAHVNLSVKSNEVQGQENDNKETPVITAGDEKEKEYGVSLRRNKQKDRSEPLGNSNSNIDRQHLHTTAENEPDANRGTISSTSTVKSIMKNRFGSEYEEFVTIDSYSFFSKPGKINKVVSFLLPDTEGKSNKVDKDNSKTNKAMKKNTKLARKHSKKR